MTVHAPPTRSRKVREAEKKKRFAIDVKHNYNANRGMSRTERIKFARKKSEAREKESRYIRD